MNFLTIKVILFYMLSFFFQFNLTKLKYESLPQKIKLKKLTQYG
jgi:hypothetical protein